MVVHEAPELSWEAVEGNWITLAKEQSAIVESPLSSDKYMNSED